MFSSNEAPPICRPKDPPPPPPPVEQKLLPVTPPRKCFPMFTNDELDRINSVINCQRMGDQDSHSAFNKNYKTSCIKTIFQNLFIKY